MSDRAVDGTSRGAIGPDRLTLALDAAGDAFFEVDLAARTIRWSRGVSLLFGHDPDAVGTDLARWQELIHPDDATEVRASGGALIPSRATAWNREFRFRRADGSYAPVRARSFVAYDRDRPTYVVGSLTDLSEIRERESEVRELNEELTRTVEQLREERSRADLIMRAAAVEVLGDWDLGTGVMSWSPNAIELLGYAPGEIADLDRVLSHVDPAEGARLLADFRRAVASGAESWSDTVTWIRPDRTPVKLSARVFVVRGTSGQAVRAVGSLSTAQPVYADPVPHLTERQRQVLRMVRAGRSNKEIAAAIGTSEQGAKAQVSKLLRKFGAANRASLVAAADALGIRD